MPTGATRRSSPRSPSSTATWTCRTFARALVRLPDDQREALVLVGAAGFSYEEAAEISGCAVGTIKSRVNRARNRLAEMLGMDAEADGPKNGAAEQDRVRLQLWRPANGYRGSRHDDAPSTSTRPSSIRPRCSTRRRTCSARGLSVEDKQAILVRWEADAEALLRATEEGMPPADNRNPDGSFAAARVHLVS